METAARCTTDSLVVWDNNDDAINFHLSHHPAILSQMGCTSMAWHRFKKEMPFVQRWLNLTLTLKQDASHMTSRSSLMSAVEYSLG